MGHIPGGLCFTRSPMARLMGFSLRGCWARKSLRRLGLRGPRQRKASASAMRADGALDHVRCVLIL
eukprot:12264291-Prorocentrum_lima.AAC.1